MDPLPDLVHTYGRNCRLQPVSEPKPPPNLEGIPPICAQYFYSSQTPIDDPLAAASAGAADGKGSLRPFSIRDNIALEKAWLGLGSALDCENHFYAQRNRSPSSSLSRANTEKLASIVHRLVITHAEKHACDGQPLAIPASEDGPGRGALDTNIPTCCPELLVDVSGALEKEFCILARQRQNSLGYDRVVQMVMAQLSRGLAGMEPAALHAEAGQTPDPFGASRDKNQLGRFTTRAGEAALSAPSTGSLVNQGSLPASSVGKGTLARHPGVDDGISGNPFLRVESGNTSRSFASVQIPGIQDGQPCLGLNDARRARTLSSSQKPLGAHRDERGRSAEVPVGISKLHMVSLPYLQMKPIYWSPVNDVSIVLRATWFYEDSMTPVEATVANQLEAGYRELRPWTETWSDEIRSALRVGPEGEEKVSHRLWPEELAKDARAKDAPPLEPLISSNSVCAARCFRGEAATEGTLELVHPSEGRSITSPEARNYSNYHVIYKDGSRAFLLKQSFKPSAYYNRRPVTKIMKGVTVGVPVVRGFNRHVWDQFHRKAASTRRSAAPQSQPTMISRPEAPGSPSSRCPGCEHDQQREQITDLILVAHGIGQKYSRRVETYSFTLAINAFRRAINVELQDEAVRSVLREDQSGIMILPVNWRLAVSLDVEDVVDETQDVQEGFTLKDIEPNSIKAVRGIISEVMFDIPYYMSSKHKPKMTAALVSEANRIMRLWDRNHIGERKPRIHFIGHSLGSAMLLDVLSNQPTVAPALNLNQDTDSKCFEFNTTNLFFLGSPAGFFLLLERGNLCPRRGRRKPGADPHDTASDNIVGDAGQLGCLAVDNVYNILAREDPIAYNLNGTIDPAYAASLKEAYLPTTATSLLNTVRGIVGFTPTSEVSGTSKPPAIRLPSQLELEVHDFTREEIAEKKAFLLNDNGQIDYFLRSGGGPLEIQYLNMLSAHTSYWTNQDLIRMLCLEIGRRPGKNNTLFSMRAVKAAKRPMGSH